VSNGILIGYFAKKDEARKSLRDLAQQGFHRAVLVHKGTGGDVHYSDPFLRYRAIGMFIFALLCGATAEMAISVFHGEKYIPLRNSPPSIALILVSAGIGALVALLWLRRSRYGVETGVIRNYAHWLVPGESVLILQASVESLQKPVAWLRESGDPPPALFIVHPKREWLVEARGPEVKLSPEQIIEHSRRHAREQQVRMRYNIT